jgi:hypothetical protein
MLGWVVGLTMQIIAGATARLALDMSPFFGADFMRNDPVMTRGEVNIHRENVK